MHSRITQHTYTHTPGYNHAHTQMHMHTHARVKAQLINKPTVLMYEMVTNYLLANCSGTPLARE